MNLSVVASRRSVSWLLSVLATVLALVSLPVPLVHADDPSGKTDSSGSTPASAEPLSPINHIVVIYQENHSFDNLFGTFPGANGIAQSDTTSQVNRNGKPYQKLPRVFDTDRWTGDFRFSSNLPNQPFSVDQYVPPAQKIPDPVHMFYQNQLQIDRGKNDKFVAWSDTGGLTMGYYDASSLPLYSFARQYTLLDNFFQAAFGGSFLNHIWLIAAATPIWKDAPQDVIARPVLDTHGKIVGLARDGVVTPDGYAMNYVQSSFQPHDWWISRDHLLPPQTMPTIGDRMIDKGISWAWYSGGWDFALAGDPDPSFQSHHQPFAFFAAYGDGTTARNQHLKDETVFFRDVDQGTLPSVSFIKPIGQDNEHPGYSSLVEGQQHVADIVRKIQGSRYWKDSVIIVTYDEYGGFWDHVSPPEGDRWGPGTRIPAIVISPFARKGYVDHTQYDTTSILRFIEWRYGLAPLSARDAGVNNLLPAFDFRVPQPTPTTTTEPDSDFTQFPDRQPRGA